MMAVLMGMCARLCLVKGKGLVTVLKSTFDKRIILGVVLLTTIANTLNIAADYGGMATSAALVVHLPEALWIVAFGILLVYVEIYVSYRAFAQVVKWLCLSLLAYVATAIIVHPNWGAVLAALVVPHVQFTTAWATTFLAVLGTTITPYLFIWQGSMYLEERSIHHQGSLADAHADVNAGMIYSNAMTFFIIVTTAVTLGATHHSIATAQDAAAALRPLAGNFAASLFAIGIVGTGLLAIPVIAGASAYAISDYFGWRDSLDDRPRQAPAFYTIVALGLVGGLAMALLHLDAMKMLLYSAAFNGIAVVPLIYYVVRAAASRKVLGPKASSRTAQWIGWAAFGLMAIASLAAIGAWVWPTS